MTIDVRPASATASACWIWRLGLGVEVGGGLVEHDDGRVLEQHPGDGEALLLAAGQPVAPLADERVVAVGQRRDDVVDAGGPAGLDDLGVGGVGSGVAQVGADRVVEQVGVLAHHADRPSAIDCSVTSRTSWPSMRTAPEVTS